MDVTLNEKSAASQVRKHSPESLSLNLVFLSHGLQPQLKGEISIPKYVQVIIGSPMPMKYVYTLSCRFAFAAFILICTAYQASFLDQLVNR